MGEGNEFDHLENTEAQYGKVLQEIEELGDSLRKLADTEEDPDRKQELLDISGRALQAAGTLRLEGNTEPAKAFLREMIPLVQELEDEGESMVRKIEQMIRELETPSN